MTTSPTTNEPTTGELRRHLPLLLVLFVVSGVCALVYEVVWFQLLQSVVGSTAVSLGLLLATYMGGMCIGSLALPRVVSSRLHPLRVYAALEAGIGVIGVLALFAVPFVGRVYASVAGPVFGGVLIRGLVCGVCLLPPTMLMGATLPAVSRWIEATPRGVSWMGLLYGANTVGAVLGGVLAGFYLLRRYDVAAATGVAALLNVAIAVAARWLARGVSPQPAISERPAPAARPVRAAWTIHIVIALSGAAALGAEVVWTRLLSLLLGATVYTFAIILSVFLTGLGAGSAAGAWWARRSRSPSTALAWCQLLQVLGVAWAAFMISTVLPYWPINPELAENVWLTMHLDLTRVLWVVLPPSLLWGSSFPLAIAAVAEPRADSARLVGRIYAANTVGAIVGSLAFSLVLIPLFGTRTAHQLLIVICAAGASLAFLVRGVGAPRAGASHARRNVARGRRGAIAGAAAALLLAALFGSRVPDVPGVLVAYGRHSAASRDAFELLYVGEGMNSSVAVTRLWGSGATQFHVSGRIESSTRPRDMRLQRMLGHLPAIVHGDPHAVLVVGFGAGITAGSLAVHPELRRMVVCEIEPIIPRVTSRYFKDENHDVLGDRRVTLVQEDARSFLASTAERFDVIASDPVHPRERGAASLFTREYFETLRAHLNPGGIVSQWIPLDDSNTDAVRSEIATFFEVFPNGTIWAHHEDGAGLDLVLLGTRDPLRIDLAAIETRASRGDSRRVAMSLEEVGFASPRALLMTYAGHREGLMTWLQGAEINRDRGLRLQYLAGMGGNRRQRERVYDEIVARRSVPVSLFVADDAWMRQLRGALPGYRP